MLRLRSHDISIASVVVLCFYFTHFHHFYIAKLGPKHRSAGLEGGTI